MYDKNKAVEAANKKSAFVAGINDDVKVASAKVQTSPTGLTFLEITFEKNGKEVKQTEWAPKMAPWMKTAADLEEAENRQYARMLQILTCFYPDEQLNFVGDSFKDFAAWVVDLINNADKNILTRIKLVYNKNGFLTLPNTSSNDNKFIEKMEIPKDKSELYIGPKDVIVRPVVADVEVPVDPFQTTEEANDPSSDLPF